jgi:hypothetical protein
LDLSFLLPALLLECAIPAALLALVRPLASFFLDETSSVLPPSVELHQPKQFDG